MLVLHRTTLRRRALADIFSAVRNFTSAASRTKAVDPRLSELDDNLIEDEFAVLRERYEAPKHPIILAHGLLGFDELHVAGHLLPGLKYWRGITDALAAKGVEGRTPFL